MKMPFHDRWRGIDAALHGLLRDPGRTDLVFTLIDLAQGRGTRPVLRRLVRRVVRGGGAELMARRRGLRERLQDRAWLASLPDDSFGRVYLGFMGAESLDPDSLVEASGRSERIGETPEEEWMFERLRDSHDLWHVLSGYGRDSVGEASVMAFSYGITRVRGMGLIALAAGTQGSRRFPYYWQRYLLKAWRRGRRARSVLSADYEALLPLPLPEVRRRLGGGAPRGGASVRLDDRARGAAVRSSAG